MKIIKPQNLCLLFKGCVLDRQACLSLAACACFSLDTAAPERLLDETAMWPVIEAALAPDELFDFGVPKVRGEFLVYGSAFSPKPVRGLEVQVRVGDLKKTLAIFGHHCWKIVGAGEPEPFTRMPIDYRNAFGGPDFPENPLGKGIVPDATGRTPLPNIQDPRNLVVSPKDRRPPAGFCAYPLTWPQRLQHLGKVDERWLFEDWPHFPSDTNGELFNTAPIDQRLPGFFTGTEKIEIRGMHPTRPLLSSALPALRARIFVNQRDGEKDIFREVPVRAETLWLFPDREVGILLYRGRVAVADEEYEDILHLYGQWESLHEPPQTIAVYAGRFREELAPSGPAETAPPVPEPASEMPAAPLQPRPEAPAVRPELAALLQEAQDFEARAIAMLKKAGLDPATAMKPFLPVAEPAFAGSREELALAVAALEKQTAALMKIHGLTEADIAKFIAPQPQAPVQSADELIAVLKKAGIDDPVLAAQFRAAEQQTQKAATALDDRGNAPVAVAPPDPSAPSPPPAGLTPTVEDVMARYSKGESLGGLDLTGLDFSGRKMPGADFSGAVLPGAGFRKTDLKKALFREAVLKDADFSDADLTGASLEKADASGGRFCKGRLSGANLSAGDFTGADFTEAELSGAAAAGATFEKAVMEGIQAQKMAAPGTIFAGANLNDADFTLAELKDADFSGAAISDCILSGAQAAGLRLNGATGERCRFGRACLAGSRADADTCLTDARFYSVDLTDACWEGARLPRAQMIEASLDRSDFSKCDLSGAIMILAKARETKFMRADLTYANLSGINLFKGSLRKAKLTRTDFRMSNLYGVDFYKARMSKNTMSGANIKKTLLQIRQAP